MPTIYEEALGAQEGRDIAGAWAGGLLGMDVTDKVLNSLKVCDLKVILNLSKT